MKFLIFCLDQGKKMMLENVTFLIQKAWKLQIYFCIKSVQLSRTPHCLVIFIQEISIRYSDIVTSHKCLLSTWDVASVTEELNFQYYLILGNLHLKYETRFIYWKTTSFGYMNLYLKL